MKLFDDFHISINYKINNYLKVFKIFKVFFLYFFLPIQTRKTQFELI